MSAWDDVNEREHRARLSPARGIPKTRRKRTGPSRKQIADAWKSLAAERGRILGLRGETVTDEERRCLDILRAAGEHP